MAVMDEQAPGGAPAPGTLPGTPTLSPQALILAALLSKQFGQPSAAAGMSGAAPQSTAAVTPLAVPSGAGGGGSNMPPGVGGVPANNLPTPAGPPNSRPLPTPMAMLGGNFSYPNKQARNGAVVATGIENMSEAIHNFKVQKDTNEYQKAKSTWDLYQKAAALNPQTGQPVDPHTMSILQNDPKIVKSWEKYLKLDFPQQQAIPPSDSTAGAGSKKGSAGASGASQSAPVMPQPTADPQAMAKQLVAQRQLEQLRAAQGETGGLTPEESHKAALIEAGITPKATDQKALDKIDAEIANQRSEVAEHQAQVAKLQQELKNISPNDPMQKAKLQSELALAKERIAQAQKDLIEAGKSKTLQEFTVGRTSFKDELATQSKSLTKMQSQAMNSRSKIGKAFGTTPDVTPEMEAQQDRVTALNDAYSSYINMQDDVEAGRVNAADAMLKARRSANLDSSFNLWGGMPSDAPPPKGIPDGAKWVSPDTGETIGVVSGGKWVAP